MGTPSVDDAAVLAVPHGRRGQNPRGCEHTEDDEGPGASAGRFGWRFAAAEVIARVTGEPGD